MPKYKTLKKSVDACQYDGNNKIFIEQWMIGRYDPDFQLDEWIGSGPYFDALLVVDNDRKITARQYDYVVRGENGKFYSVNRDIFETFFVKEKEQ